MIFAHIHSTKEKLYGLFNLHVQLDFTIGEGKILFSVNKRQGVIGQKLEFHKVGEFRSRYFEVFC